ERRRTTFGARSPRPGHGSDERGARATGDFSVGPGARGLWRRWRAVTAQARQLSSAIPGTRSHPQVRAACGAQDGHHQSAHVSMSHFPYRDGILHAEGVALDQLALAVGTPFYCYSSAALSERYHAFLRAFDGARASVCYSLKANSNQAVIATCARLGAGADVVSEGELRRALAAGVPAARIVFAGVGKTAAEMAAAVEAGIQQFNVESLPELELLDRIARARGARARVALRVNPDVDARTHRKIATGKAENKFGIDLGHVRDIYGRAADMEGI